MVLRCHIQKAQRADRAMARGHLPSRVAVAAPIKAPAQPDTRFMVLTLFVDRWASPCDAPRLPSPVILNRSDTAPIRLMIEENK
jgi:hypothetical protein